MSAARKREIVQLADGERRFRCSVRDNLLALRIAAEFETDLVQAQAKALGILDWAVRESDECPRRKLEEESQAAFKERGR